MLHALENIKALKGYTAAGVQLTLHPDDKINASVVILKKLKNMVDVKDCFTGIDTYDRIFEHLKPGTPLYLSLNGKGILHKKLQSGNKPDNINQLLPNASPDDFYMQAYRINENERIVSIVRKDVVNTVLDHFNNSRHFLVEISLGPFILNSVVGLLENQDGYLNAAHYKILLENDKISQIEHSDDQIQENKYLIAGESLTDKNILPYALALQHFTGVSDHVVFEAERPPVQQEEFIYKKLYGYLGYGMLGLFFIILLINYLVFTGYQNRTDNLTQQISANTGMIEKLDKLNKEFRVKNDLVIKSGLLQQTMFSYYADCIASSVPPEITLTKMALFPLQDKVRSGEEIRFDRKIIRIEGKTKYSIRLNNWLNMLKKENWIKNVKVNDFYQDDLHEPGEFAIEIILKSK